jgi:hypothetical protein
MSNADAVARFEERVEERREYLDVLVGPGEAPPPDSQYSELTDAQLRRRAGFWEKYGTAGSVAGNPNEWYTACPDDGACEPMRVMVNSQGDISAVVVDEDGERVEGPNTAATLPFACPSCDQTAFARCGSDAGTCGTDVLLAEGNVLVDQRTGQGFRSEGVRYTVGEGDSAHTYETLAQCTAAHNTAERCRSGARQRGLEAEHYYWSPSSWTDFLRGGPGTQMYRSISSLIPESARIPELVKWEQVLDTYFNIEQWTIEDLCSGIAPTAAGVGYSPVSNGIPTATIQAQGFKVEPCKGLESAARDRCLQNRSTTKLKLDSTQDYYYIYRVTGKLIPKDCEMKFNIYLDDVALYDTERVAQKGAPPFDLSGVGALVTGPQKKWFNKVCIKFADDWLNSACIKSEGKWGQPEICNKVYVSDDDDVTQHAVEEEGAGAGDGISYSEGGPTTSSTAGCSLC